jgi:hypothetical protein
MANTFELIASVTASGSSSSIEFTSIPSTYTDLCLDLSIRSARVDTDDTIYMDFNAYAGTNLSQRRLEGNGSSVSSSSASLIAFRANAANNTASTFTSAMIYLPNYASSNNKSLSLDSAFENNSSTAYLNLIAGLWSSTTAISSLKVYPASASNFAQYSTAYLYGVKNA